MDPKALAVGVVGAAAIGLGLVAAKEVGDNQVKSIIIANTLPPVATVEAKVGPTMQGNFDGGSITLAEHLQSDGGRVWLRVGGGKGCVRKPVDAILPCGRGPNTLNWVDYGVLNRFPSAEAQPAVNGCESVTCAVWEGENANLGEVDLLSSLLGLRLP